MGDQATDMNESSNRGLVLPGVAVALGEWEIKLKVGSPKNTLWRTDGRSSHKRQDLLDASTMLIFVGVYAVGLSFFSTMTNLVCS